jgi:competence protein ComEC
VTRGGRASHDLRLVPTALGLWLGCWAGTATATWPAAARAAAAVAGGCLLVAGVAGLGTRRWPAGSTVRRATQGGLVLVAVGGGLLLGWTRVSATMLGPLPGLARQQAVARVEIVTTGDPRVLTPTVRGDALLPARRLVPARAEVVAARGSVARVRTPVTVLSGDAGWDHLLPGTRLLVTGRLQVGPDRAVTVRTAAPPPVLAEPPWWQHAAGVVRRGLQDAAGGPSADGAALLPGLVVGDTSAMSVELVDAMRAAGLTHLTAVSGGNVAVVVGSVLWVARGLGVRGRGLVAAAVAAVAAFLVVTRAEPSVLRAAVMAGVGLLAVATGRARRSLPALAGAVLVLLAADPTLARSYGFALSVLATAGLVLWAGPWGRSLGGWLTARRCPVGPARTLGYALAVPLAAQVAVAPVLVLLNPTVSLVSVPANLLAAPAVAPATVLGLVAGLVELVHPPVGDLIGWTAGVPAAWITLVGHAGAGLPGARLPWPAGPGGALALAGLLTAVWTTGRVLRRPGARRRARDAIGAGLARPVRVLGLVVVVAVGLGGAGLATRRTGEPGWPPPGWAVVACDVGQGDALVLHTGEGQAVVVDAGPDPDRVDGCLRRLGIRHVPLLVVTHLHADHVEGVPGVLRGRRVDEVLVGPYGEPAAEADRLTGWLRDAAVPAAQAAVGSADRIGQLRLRVLGPERVITGEGSTPNNASLVLWAATGGVRVLLAGDVEPPAARMLLASAAWPGSVPVDVLKVPHHGSAYQDPRLLAGSGATVALISVGADNDYGHPAPVTLQALRADGLLVARTDRVGDVAVTGPADRLTVTARSAGRQDRP